MRGSGGGGGGRGSVPHRKITRYMGRSRSKPFITLTKFPGSAHLFHWNALEPMPNGRQGLGGGDSIPARGLGLAENDDFHMA